MDLRNLNIERLLQNDPFLPTFFAYYCTTEGDILGKLMLTKYEVLFEPLNEKLKGYYHYADGNIRDNSKMGFIIGYAEMMGEPQIVTSIDPKQTPDDEGDSQPLVYHIQIEFAHTGFYDLASEKVKGRLEKFKEDKKPIASIGLKINRTNLLNEVLLNDEKRGIAEKLVSFLKEGRKNALEMESKDRSATKLPCFDINFRNILDIKQDVLVSSQTVETRLKEVVELFGFEEHILKLSHLNNSSLNALDIIFPDLQKDEEEDLITETLLEKSEHLDLKHSVKFISLKGKIEFEKKCENSRILTFGLKTSVLASI